MPRCEGNTLTLESVQNYFAHLNPIAQRIAYDIQNTKATYGHLWYTLSTHDQNDIINDTLIKPEISLKYYVNCSSTCSSPTTLSNSDEENNTATKSDSSNSLASVVLRNVNNALSSVLSIKTETERSGVPSSKEKSTTSYIKNYYGYDGRNLKTYVLQKVALKIIQDDTVGRYHNDEHSLPFSYHTKSQMNLHMFKNDMDEVKKIYSSSGADDDMLCLLNAQPPAGELFTAVKINAKYKKVNKESAKKIKAPLNTPTNSLVKYNQFKNDKDISLQAAATGSLSQSAIDKTDKKDTNSNAYKNDKQIKNGKNEILLKAYIDTVNTRTSPTYAIYTDVYFDQQESTNLMPTCGSSNYSGSHLAGSDDERDHFDNDEGVKLLDDMNMRRGFDFLNNW